MGFFMEAPWSSVLAGSPERAILQGPARRHFAVEREHARRAGRSKRLLRSADRAETRGHAFPEGSCEILGQSWVDCPKISDTSARSTHCASRSRFDLHALRANFTSEPR